MEAGYCSPALNNSVIKSRLWLILAQEIGYLVTEWDSFRTLTLKKHMLHLFNMRVCVCVFVCDVCICAYQCEWVQCARVRIILSSQFSPSILVTRDWTQVFKLALNHLPGKAFDSLCSGSGLYIFFLRIITWGTHLFKFHNALMFFIFLIWKPTLM